MNQLKIFVAAFHDSQFIHIPASPCFQPVNLQQLDIGEHQLNYLAEHRLYLSDLPEKSNAKYLGLLTWRWHQKCMHLVPLTTLPSLTFAPNNLWYAWPANDWYNHSEREHPGIRPYLDELLEFTGMHKDGAGFYANQFICSRERFMAFREFFLNCFYHFHAKYKDQYKFFCKPNHIDRAPGCFYERIATLYFSNQNDLILNQIPVRPRQPQRRVYYSHPNHKF